MVLLNYKNVENNCESVLSPYCPLKYSPDAENIMVIDENCMFRRVLPLLMNHPKKFNLIYYATDYDFTPQYFECLKPRVKHIYAQGCRINDPLITKIPSGFASTFNENFEVFNKKEILCYLPKLGLFDDNNLHHLPGRLLRQDCNNYFRNKKFVTIETERLDPTEYTEKIQKSKFVICPMGVGIDSYKIYESAYLGSIPVVIKNGMEDLYEKFGALILNNWDELTVERMKNHKEKKVPPEMFTMEYWIPFDST
jgi:hypothetical protein